MKAKQIKTIKCICCEEPHKLRLGRKNKNIYLPKSACPECDAEEAAYNEHMLYFMSNRR